MHHLRLAAPLRAFAASLVLALAALPGPAAAAPVSPAVAPAAADARTPANAVSWEVDHKAKTITATIRLHLVTACDERAVAVARRQGPAAVARCELTPDMLAAIRANIENAWNAGLTFKCYRLVVKTNITMSNEKKGTKAAAANPPRNRLVVGIDQSAAVTSSFVQPADLPDDASWNSTRPEHAIVAANDTDDPSTWKYPGNWANTYAHEAGHILGLDDTYEVFTRDDGHRDIRPLDGAPSDMMYKPSTATVDPKTVELLVRRAGIDVNTLKGDYSASRSVPGGTWTGTKCGGLDGTWVLEADIKTGPTKLDQVWTATIDPRTLAGTFTYDDQSYTAVSGSKTWGWGHSEGNATVAQQPDGSVLMTLVESLHYGWGKGEAAGQTVELPRTDQPLVTWEFQWMPFSCSK